MRAAGRTQSVSNPSFTVTHPNASLFKPIQHARHHIDLVRLALRRVLAPANECGFKRVLPPSRDQRGRSFSPLVSHLRLQTHDLAVLGERFPVSERAPL